MSKQNHLKSFGRTRIVLRKPVPERNFHNFQQEIWQFYRKHKRPMPWRETDDPYRILVSEIMLQQTQASRVLTKYPEFIKTFADFHQLNKASFPKVLTVWQGMGYNRRAKYLKQIAQKVIREFAGRLPLDPRTLETFPGIGKATAASIVVFSTNQPLIFIETNIRRVYLDHFFPKTKSVNDKQILQLVEVTLDRDKPREWYYALMDYGNWLGKTTPNSNRRSQHYTRQSPFSGSLRQVRGQILQALLNHGAMDSAQLKQTITGNTAHFREALAQLKAERLVEVKRRKVTLPSRL